jgi:peptide/nickel transport system permease protein
VASSRTPFPGHHNVARLAGMFPRKGTARFGLIVVLLFVLTAALAPLLAPHDPIAADIRKRLLPPFWSSGNTEYLLGTDPIGRDVLSRIIYGSRISLLVGVVAVALRGSAGVLLGLAAGYYRGKLDSIIMRIGDIQLAVPPLILAVGIIAVLGRGLGNLLLVLGITGWMSYGRLVRGEVLSVREKEFVEAARAVGCEDWRIMFRHILPNVAHPVLVFASLDIAAMILVESTLSFLGLGVAPPVPSWGSMIADGRDYLATSWWVSVFPGAAILLTILGINLLADWLRERLDPKWRSRR